MAKDQGLKMKDPQIAKRLEISGVVQGVGFRPFLFGLARTHGVTGQVSNTSQGVLALVQGSAQAIEGFIRDIGKKAPPLSQVLAIDSRMIPVQGFSGFDIVKSQSGHLRATLISPDVSVCEDCLAEMRDPANPRFEYPFINCTHCGPRYTIIQDLPYDRPQTSMKGFKMCGNCQKEYEDPLDRRFHAQPNACPVCGPHVFLVDHQGIRQDQGPGHALDLAGQLLTQGKILAVKGLGGFHLAADACNDASVAQLRQRKSRPHKPFALMAASLSVLLDHVVVDEREKSLLHAFQRPIVLLDKKKGHTGLSPGVAPFNTCLGVMLPYTPLHYLLVEKGPPVLVMTSGNRSGEPLSIDNADALEAFGSIADYFLLHDREIYFRADDSIARILGKKQRFVRRSRGYAPLPVSLNQALPPLLGCGAGLKSTICLTRGNNAFLSQHIGDLDNPKAYQFFVQTIDHMKRILDIEPVLVAHDLHPGYMSTEYAKSLEAKGIACIPVQHHHAHAVSCMAENCLEGPVIALTLDGTGYGTDGHIWGGEILTCTPREFSRRAQLSYLPMPGGDAAVLEPWRMAVAVLFKAYGWEFLELEIPFIRSMDSHKMTFLCQMMEKNLNCPLTSSAGRLFDAVASLLGICHFITHESQAAMELEAAAGPNKADQAGRVYPFHIMETFRNSVSYYQIDMMPCIREMVKDLIAKKPLLIISAKFHTTLVQAFVAAAFQVGQETGITQTILSGGVFNNARILTQTISGLEQKGFIGYTHTQVPFGDGGISLGQVVVAAAQMGAVG